MRFAGGPLARLASKPVLDEGLLGPRLADALVAAAWCALVLDAALQLRRERAARGALGPVVAAGWRPAATVRAAVVVATLAAGVTLERLGGRLPHRPAVAAIGLALVAGGVLLHMRARRALGPLWSGIVTVRTGHAVVADGPYGVVRHPLYVALALVATGSFLAHPSLAIGCAAAGALAGIALKIPREERVLGAALGADWARYAARVPAVVPRIADAVAALGRAFTGTRR